MHVLVSYVGFLLPLVYLATLSGRKNTQSSILPAKMRTKLAKLLLFDMNKANVYLVCAGDSEHFIASACTPLIFASHWYVWIGMEMAKKTGEVEMVKFMLVSRFHVHHRFNQLANYKQSNYPIFSECSPWWSAAYRERTFLYRTKYLITYSVCCVEEYQAKQKFI